MILVVTLDECSLLGFLENGKSIQPAKVVKGLPEGCTLWRADVKEGVDGGNDLVLYFHAPGGRYTEEDDQEIIFQREGDLSDVKSR